MYLRYDTLSEDPLQVAALEPLFLNDMSFNFVASYVRAEVMRWHNPLPG